MHKAQEQRYTSGKETYTVAQKHRLIAQEQKHTDKNRNIKLRNRDISQEQTHSSETEK